MGWRWWIPAVVANAATTVGSLWLPWVQVGSTHRTSFGAFRSAQRLGLDELAPLRVFWFLVPVLGLVAIGAAVLGQRRTSAIVLAVFSLLVGAAGVVLAVSGVSVWGTHVSLILVVLSLLVSALVMVQRSSPQIRPFPGPPPLD